METNHEWTRIDTQIDGPTSTTSSTQMFLQFRVLGVTGAWDDGFLGARASRPHKAWHSLAYLPHLDRPGTAPWLPSAWPMRFPPTGWLPEASHRGSVAFKGTGCGRGARAPRRCRPGGAVGGVWPATSQKAALHPLGNSRLPASRTPALACGGAAKHVPGESPGVRVEPRSGGST